MSVDKVKEVAQLSTEETVELTVETEEKTVEVEKSKKDKEEEEEEEEEEVSIITPTETAKEDADKPKESSNSDDSEPEYEVEKIIGHRIYKGKVVKYEIKWKGYPEEDNTMESANTVHADVPELCKKYWDSLDVQRPSNAPESEKVKIVEEKKVKTNKKRTTEVTDSASSTTKKSRKSNNKALEHVPKYMVKLGYVFPIDYPTKETDWVKDIKKLCVQASPKDLKMRLTYIEWKNNKKTIHEMKEIHQKAPEKLIEYYEERLQFI